MTSSSTAAHDRALAFGVAAYTAWGLVPFYFSSLNDVPPKEMLAHRVVWSLLFLSVVLTIRRGWGEFRRRFTSWNTMKYLLLSTPLISANWYVYIYSVMNSQTLQASLGYFILPLVNVAIGMIFFGERLRPAQGLAVALAAAGVAIMVIHGKIFPWIALTLAITFSLYGVMRKLVPMDSVVGLMIETALLTPLALLCLEQWSSAGVLHFGTGNVPHHLLIVASGVVTIIPLICFAEAMKKLQLITMGFLQYIAPSLAMLVAILYLNEPFTPAHQECFGLIWLGLGIFVGDAIFGRKKADF